MRASPRCAGRWLLALVLLSCAGPISYSAGVYRHREHGYRLGAPRGAQGTWERIEVEGATLAFRGPGAATAIVKSRCGRPVAAVQLMARHLLIGLAERELLEARPVALSGRSGWLQVVDTRDGDGPVRLKTVTLVEASCSYDLVLAAARERYAAVEADFDAWWQGFALDGAGSGA